ARRPFGPGRTGGSRCGCPGRRGKGWSRGSCRSDPTRRPSNPPSSDRRPWAGWRRSLPPEDGARSGAARKAPEKASERLRRLLTVVPYLVRNQGTRVAEAADLFGMSEPELLADLDLLFVSGLPPYGPGDLIDVDIQDGRIWIGMADYFARPLRLTRSEALAIYLRGTVLGGAAGLEAGTALSSALAKLADALGPETLGGLPERGGLGGGGRRPGTRARLAP